MTANAEDRPRMVGLVEENLMRLKLVELVFDPQQNVVVITGRNRQGKSCLLDGVAMALGGERLVPAKPIRSGQKTARVEVALSNGLKIERRFTASGSSLRVRGPDGECPSPQAILDKLLGKGKVLAFDPSAFASMAPADQAKAVKDAAGLDLSDLEQAQAEHYEARRDAGRDLKVAEARLSGMTTYPDAPAEQVDTKALLDAVAAGQRQNAQVDRLGAEAKRLTQAAEVAEAEADRRDEAAKVARKAAQEARGAAEAEFHTFLQAPAKVGVGALLDQLRTADVSNAQVRANKAAAVVKQDVEATRKVHDGHERALAEIAGERERRLSAAKMPVEGLTFGDEGLLFNGIPVAQASQAEQVELGAAVAAALQPDFRLLLMRDGSLLDEEAWDRLRKFADVHDAQILIERVGTGQPGEVVIEDGEVVPNAKDCD